MEKLFVTSHIPDIITIVLIIITAMPSPIIKVAQPETLVAELEFPDICTASELTFVFSMICAHAILFFRSCHALVNRKPSFRKRTYRNLTEIGKGKLICNDSLVQCIFGSRS